MLEGICELVIPSLKVVKALNTSFVSLPESIQREEEAKRSMN
jgi:hypothetical protein